MNFSSDPRDAAAAQRAGAALPQGIPPRGPGHPATLWLRERRLRRWSPHTLGVVAGGELPGVLQVVPEPARRAGQGARHPARRQHGVLPPRVRRRGPPRGRRASAAPCTATSGTSMPHRGLQDRHHGLGPGLPGRRHLHPHMVTREETPQTLWKFVQQRVRWDQGFIQVFVRGGVAPAADLQPAADGRLHPRLPVLPGLHRHRRAGLLPRRVRVQRPGRDRARRVHPLRPGRAQRVRRRAAAARSSGPTYAERVRLRDYAGLVLGAPLFQLALGAGRGAGAGPAPVRAHELGEDHARRRAPRPGAAGPPRCSADDGDRRAPDALPAAASPSDRAPLRHAAAAARAGGCGLRRRPGCCGCCPWSCWRRWCTRWGMDNFPRWVDDPGTYLSQAWSVQYEQTLSPYSYFYDHAPAGWIQIALWSMLTGGFDRYDSAIGVRQRVHAARQVRLDRPALLAGPAAAASPGPPRPAVGLLFALSPLALDLHALDLPGQPRHALDPAGLRARAVPPAHDGRGDRRRAGVRHGGADQGDDAACWRRRCCGRWCRTPTGATGRTCW